jgi:hypothetical protein
MSVRRPMVAALAALSLLGAGLVSSSVALAAEALEAPATPTAEGVTATTAKLKGELNPGAGAAESSYHFLYTPGTSATGCEGAAAPEPAGTGAGNHHAVGPAEVTGLQPNTEYAFCLQAFNETEALSSPVATFKTLKLAPSVEGQGAPIVTPFDATLEAQVNPNNEETSWFFEYATNEGFTGAKQAPASPGILNGFGNQGVNADIGGGLTPNTTYYYRAVATNETGTTDGSPVATFTTPESHTPEISEEAPTELTSGSVLLHAQIEPDFQITTYAAECGTGAEPFNAPQTYAGGEFPVMGGFQPASIAVGGLTPNTVYSCRFVASNAKGNTTAGGVSFQTQSQPVVTTGASSYVTRTSAVLAGTVEPAGVYTAYHFAYGPTTGYGSNTSEVGVGEGYETKAANATLEELTPGTTYHYALVATNIYGTVVGADHTFTTSPATPPLASTGGTVNVGHQTATLTGSVEPDGLQTTYEFQLGTEAGVYYAQAVGSSSGSGQQGISAELQALAPGTTYHYRVVARNQDGESVGQDQTFTTESYPNPLTVPVSPALIPVAPAAVTPPTKVVAKKPVKHKKKAKKKKKKKKKKK